VQVMADTVGQTHLRKGQKEISSRRLPVVDVEFTLQRYQLGEIARDLRIEIEGAVMR
jgi:hypothetical protein